MTVIMCNTRSIFSTIPFIHALCVMHVQSSKLADAKGKASAGGLLLCFSCVTYLSVNYSLSNCNLKHNNIPLKLHGLFFSWKGNMLTGWGNAFPVPYFIGLHSCRKAPRLRSSSDGFNVHEYTIRRAPITLLGSNLPFKFNGPGSANFYKYSQ